MQVSGFKASRHPGITDKFLEGIPQAQKTILVSSFAASVQRNKFGKTRKHILLHGTVKSAILNISASFRTYLQSNPTLESSGKKSLILQRQLWGYKTLDPPTKHQKDIPESLFLNIYKRTDTHLNTAIGQLIPGAFFFGMRSCEYSTTPKRDNKRTRILQKRDIRFYRKRRELSHDSGIFHLSDKVSPTFRTNKNGFKNATVGDNHNPLSGVHLGRNHHPTGLRFGNKT